MIDNNRDRILEKYPWIQFSLNLSALPWWTWVQLGKSISKCKHISWVPLKPKVRKKLHEVYLTKGINATTAIEGNTLSEEQVAKRIQGQLDLPPSQEYMGQEVDNVLEACNFVLEQLKQDKVKDLTVGDICTYNGIILKNVASKDVTPGVLRKHNVGVGNYRAPDFKDVPYLMDELCGWLNRDFQELSDRDAFLGSILKAIATHLYIAWIHPFGDGNGRVARLMEVKIMLSGGIPSAAAHLLSNHYNATRTKYIQQLDMASKAGTAIDFIAYAVQGFLDGLTNQLKDIRKQVTDVSWINYVHEQFSDRHSEAARRQRKFVLLFSDQDDFVPKENIRELTPKIMGLYTGKTVKTFDRDLKVLLKMDLIEKKENGYKARKEKIFEFLPFQV